MTLTVEVPEELSARVPAEQRGPGLGRDAVRLLVSRGTEVSHHAFRDLPGLLGAGDVLIVNTSTTLAAAVDGRTGETRWGGGRGARGEREAGEREARKRQPRDREAREAGERGGHVRRSDGVRSPSSVSSASSVSPGSAVSAGSAGSAGSSLAASSGPVVVHFSGRGDDGRWAVEVREPVAGGVTRPRAGGPAGAEIRVAGGAWLVLEEPLSARSDRLWWARVSGPDVLGVLREHGRPIRYSYTERDQPLSVYQTVFALPSADGAGSAEMPSAARPFTAGLVTELVSRGVWFAPVTLHTGVASAEAHEPPYPEWFSVPEASARLINGARAAGGRVVAVGTTAVRAVESAAGRDGVVRARAGWTDLVVTPERGVRVVDGLLTGLHEPGASHLLMLEAVAGRAAVARGYEAAVRGRYLWHEFGDVHLLLPAENPHTEHCVSNRW